ncbi:YebC/PmpR family DNA-binding transcriptional regulator [Candidatus Roizmanbacteria bacterium]|nr:YebC/PmpR family DNA-binding transcriptional regulator [Candidatus Roizmanbacteria bacterium]
MGQNTKEAKDKEKGKIFSKLTRLIAVSVADGGGVTDPEMNVKLRLAIEKAKAANMPKENIKRAVEKGSGPERARLREIIYEGFGPEGVALLIQTTTDNSNRTHSEVKNTLEKYGGKMAGQGSVGYLFQKCGTITFDRKEKKEDEIFSFADKVSAFDIEEDGTSITLYFPFESLGKVSGAEPDYKPRSYIKIGDREKAKRVLATLEKVEELDDVQRVFANFDIPEEYMT